VPFISYPHKHSKFRQKQCYCSRTFSKIKYERLKIAVPKLARQLQDTFKDNAWNERVATFEAALKWKLADSWLRSLWQLNLMEESHSGNL